MRSLRERRRIEGGVHLRDVRAGSATILVSVTGYYGWYHSFIDQRQIGGTFSPTDPALFQFVNVGQVRLAGVEAPVG